MAEEAAATVLDRALARAAGLALVAATLQGLVMAVAGSGLYRPWWWPVEAVTVLAVVGNAVVDRRRPVGPVGAAAMTEVRAASGALTSFATLDAQGVATAALPPAFMFVAGRGLQDRPATALVLGGASIAPYVASLATTRPDRVDEVVSIAVGLVCVLMAAIGGGTAARRLSATEAASTARLARAVTADRAAAAGRSDREETERQLHDTVLNTLTALSRAGLPDGDAVRRVCAADAALLRRLLERTSTGAPTRPLAVELEDLRSRFAAVGLTVRLPAVAPGADLPADVVSAISGAALEALNNVLRHSGTTEAELWAGPCGDPFELRVRDRGRGIPHEPGPEAFGIGRSIVARMAEVGGAAVVGPRHGGGTEVRLCWPG